MRTMTTSKSGGRVYANLPWLIAGMTVVALGIGALALYYIETRLVAATGESLALAATDIADKLDQALFERYGDAQIAATSAALYMQDPATLSRHLNRIKEQYLMYRWIGVTDTHGRVVAATNPADVGADRSAERWFQAVRDGRAVHMQDVQRTEGENGSQAIGFSTPMIGSRGEWLGVLSMRVGISELENVFARTVSTIQAQRGGIGKLEWQFLRRDGTVIADSMLREEGRANLKQEGLASALLSEAAKPGYVEEEHLRRHVPVVTGFARTEGYGEFPGFQWGVLVRLDRDDILSPIRSVLWKLGLVGAAVWLPMLGLLIWTTGRLRGEWSTAEERGRRLSTILTSIGDAVIVADVHGCVVFMNPVAQTLTGWNQTDAAGKSLDSIFVIVNETTRQTVESPVAKVLREGTIVGLANHTVLLAKDGTEYAIDDSGAPIRDADGTITGVVLVFHDVTEQRKADALVRQRTEALLKLVAVAQRLTITTDRHQFLRIVAEAGVQLTSAQYGALGVFNETGERLDDFVTVGMDEATERAIGARPVGRGLLGALQGMEGPLRLRDLMRHHTFSGFPPHHPPMRSFLGVPIRAHGRLFGSLYLTDKQGVDEFTDLDVEVVNALAALAGSMIEGVALVGRIREAELRFRSVVQSAVDAIIVADGAGLILTWNPAAERIFGYAEEEVIGRPLASLMPERYREAHGRGIERMRATGESRLIGSTMEAHGLRKDGREFPLECSLAMWTIGDKTFFSGILRDVTERKRGERRLVAQYAVTRVLTESRSLEEAGPPILQAVCQSLEWDMGALWKVDRRGKVLRCVDIWQRSSTGLEEFKALTSRSTFPPGVGLPGRVWASGEPAWIFDVVRDDNFPRLSIAQREEVHGAFGFPIREGDTVLGVLEFFSHEVQPPDEALLQMMDDLGLKVGQFFERTQLEEQLRHVQKMDAVGRLAGGVAHDFNNLLTVIGGCSALLLRRLGPTDALRRYPLEIQQASERATSLTQQLLAFSRRQMLEPKVLTLNENVSTMDSMLRRLIGEHINLVTVLGADLGLVKADPGQIEQVIMNLAVNARDAMPEGGKLTIETANVDLDEAYASRHMAVEPGPYVMLAISDTGHGMDEETQARLFEPFFTTKEKGKGTGLGLSTVYGIVKQSGGIIWVYSEPTRGTTFKIYLPRVVAVSERASLTSVAGAEFVRGTETILLVEDEESVRALACEALEEAGFHVLGARHGAEALVISHQHQGPIHLLLTDVVMPEMSGRVLADRLAPQRPAMKILYMSGYTDNAIVHQGVIDPGTAFLHKPFSPDALVRKVREVLDTPPMNT
nr:PAS domain S-box protein [Nitrospirota bacterium]